MLKLNIKKEIKRDEDGNIIEEKIVSKELEVLPEFHDRKDEIEVKNVIENKPVNIHKLFLELYAQTLHDDKYIKIEQEYVMIQNEIFKYELKDNLSEIEQKELLALQERRTTIENDNTYLRDLRNNDFEYNDDIHRPLFNKDSLEAEVVEKLREMKKQSIKYEIIAKFNAGYKTSVNDIVMDCKAEDINNLKITIDKLTQDGALDTDTVKIRDYNNQTHDITFADLKTIVSELSTNADNLMNDKWTRQELVDAANTLDEIINV